MKKIIVFILASAIALTLLCSCGKKTDTTIADSYLSIAQEFLDNDNVDAAIDVLNKGFSETKDPRLSEKLVAIYVQRDNNMTAEPSIAVTVATTTAVTETESDVTHGTELDEITTPTTKPTTANPTAVLRPTAAKPNATAPTIRRATFTTKATEIPQISVPGTKVELTLGEIREIPQALIDAGFDTAMKIENCMISSLRILDERIDSVAIVDAKLMYSKDGVVWVEDEKSRPHTVVIPYPDGTDINTQFTVVNMSSSADSGRTPGEVQGCPLVENTEAGVIIHMRDYPPVALGWCS